MIKIVQRIEYNFRTIAQRSAETETKDESIGEGH
jgi:hypothetical protein